MTTHASRAKIAILTSGGDAPGMNAAIRALVLAARKKDMTAIGFRHGFNGLLDNDFCTLSDERVRHIIHWGGTILKSARCAAFVSQESACSAAACLNQHGVKALVIIGGDGSMAGAAHLGLHWQGQILGLPGTIDNDLSGTDDCIGFHTATDTALDAIDKIRDTADAFERIFVVEVMGRRAGHLALSSGIASGAEQILCPEMFTQRAPDIDAISAHIRRAQRRRGKASYIIVMTESIWPGGSTDLAAKVTERIDGECRPCVLGHIQRGGSPVSLDRILATRLGTACIDAVLTGNNGVMLGLVRGALTYSPFAALRDNKAPDEALLSMQMAVFDD